MQDFFPNLVRVWWAGWCSFSKGRSQIWLQVTQPSVEIFRNPIVFWGEARSACPNKKFGDFFPSKKREYCNGIFPFFTFQFLAKFCSQKKADYYLL
jgi:hypothetical protein